jgi:hypothetical protein
MALAIRFEGLIRDGQVSDQSELSRLAHVSQPRKNGSLAPVLRGEGWGEGRSGKSEIVLRSLLPQPGIVRIMNLLHLAPDIQESLLLLPRVASGKAPIHEKFLRPIAAEIDWRKQREMWAGVERALGRRPPRSWTSTITDCHRFTSSPAWTVCCFRRRHILE